MPILLLTKVITMSNYIIKKSPFAASATKLFHLFHYEKNVSFLDSSLKNKLGRFSIIGLVPHIIVESHPKGCLINGTLHPCTPEIFLKEYLHTHHQENNTSLPLLNGAIGYISYDYGQSIFHLKDPRPTNFPGAEMTWIFYDFFIIEDHLDHTVTFIAGGHTQPAEKLMHSMMTEIQKRLAHASPLSVTPSPTTAKLLSYMPEEEYTKNLKKINSYILDGHIYVINFTQMLTFQSNQSPYAFFTALRKSNPAPFGAYLNYPHCQIISASMERFIKISHGTIETRPIKGTRPRSNQPQKDIAYYQALKHSTKDKSELLMIVDLERNDLSRICQTGTITVPSLYQIEAYATVFQLVATIQGKLLPHTTAIDILPVLFPGGSITGAPKQRAMEIIAELEPTKRGIYTGSIGYISLNGDCDLNIVIRTAVHHNGIYQIGVGGGITAESDPAKEYKETWQKALALQRVLQGGYHENKL